MKKAFGILVIGLLFVLTVSSVNAQETNSGRNVRFTIKTNPLAALGGPFWVIVVPITGEYKVLFEMAVSEKSSLQLGVGYLGPSILINLDDLSSTEGSISGIKTGYRVCINCFLAVTCLPLQVSILGHMYPLQKLHRESITVILDF